MTDLLESLHCLLMKPGPKIGAKSARRTSRSAHARFCAGVSLLFVFAMNGRARADYPIMSHRYLADPGSVVYKDRVYLYNSNDDDNAEAGGYTMHSIVCVSTVDMKNWTDHGIVFQVPRDASWAQNSWAPQPIARDGKITMYFGNSGSGVGAASSTDPLGPFKDAKGSVLVDGSTPGASGTDSWLFDPGALIDDDGQAYLAFGGNGENNARIIKLGSDLASVSGSATQLAPKGFYEASFLFKRKSTYYYAYSTNSANGLRIDYLTSTSPMSGYKYGGVVAGQPPINNNNNHASEFEYKGQWYHAYHNRTVATDAGISTTYKRNLALEVLNFNDDGTIKEVAYTTDGVPQLGHLDPYTRVEAETMNAQKGIETEPCGDGGMDVTQIDNGDWIRVRGADFGAAGAKTFSARVASTKASSTIELHVGTSSGALVGTCSVPETGGAQKFMATTCDVTGLTGVNDLAFVFKGSGSNLFAFDSWQFTGGDGTVGGGGAGGGGAGGSGGAAPGGAAQGGTSVGGASTRGGEANLAGSNAGGGRSASGGSASATGGASAGGVATTGGTLGSSGTGSGLGGATVGLGGATSGGAGPNATGGSTATSGTAGANSGATPTPATSNAGCGCTVVNSGRNNTLFTLGIGIGLVALRRRARSKGAKAS
jgi:arabinoxylan arabinofuranohydrolase